MPLDWQAHSLEELKVHGSALVSWTFQFASVFAYARDVGKNTIVTPLLMYLHLQPCIVKHALLYSLSIVHTESYSKMMTLHKFKCMGPKSRTIPFVVSRRSMGFCTFFTIPIVENKNLILAKKNLIVAMSRSNLFWFYATQYSTGLWSQFPE